MVGRVYRRAAGERVFRHGIVSAVRRSDHLVQVESAGSKCGPDRQAYANPPDPGRYANWRVIGLVFMFFRAWPGGRGPRGGWWRRWSGGRRCRSRRCGLRWCYLPRCRLRCRTSLRPRRGSWRSLRRRTGFEPLLRLLRRGPVLRDGLTRHGSRLRNWRCLVPDGLRTAAEVAAALACSQELAGSQALAGSQEEAVGQQAPVAALAGFRGKAREPLEPVAVSLCSRRRSVLKWLPGCRDWRGRLWLPSRLSCFPVLQAPDDSADPASARWNG